MRIVSGIHKGKKLFHSIDKNTRPLKDLTKESIFNLLIHSNFVNIDLNNSNVLDLFSGIGSFGLECLSRNAKHVTFVENYKPAIEVFKKNIKNLKILNNYKLIEKDIYKQNFFNFLNDKFDLIFIDPPYKEERINILSTLIYENKILNKNSLIIIHRNKKSIDKISDKFKIIDERNYGISKIIFFKLK